MFKISVIVPVYKVEDYLQQCVNSIINQTYQNTEIILVDDGSPDTCPMICDSLAAKDSRVKVIHKTNGGLSDARNKGVEIATGDYGIFIDSDDYWQEKDVLEKLVSRLMETNADVLCFPRIIYDESSGEKYQKFFVPYSMPVELTSKEEQLDFLISRGLYISSAWSKIVKMILLKDNFFKKGQLSEDIEWSARLICKSRRLDYINYCFYCYRQREGSITHSITEKNCRDLKDAVINCCSMMNHVDEEIRPYLGSYTAYQFSTFIAVQSFVERFQLEIVLELDKYKKVLEYDRMSSKVRVMHFGTRIFGLVNWCRIIRITKCIWNSRRNLI